MKSLVSACLFLTLLSPELSLKIDPGISPFPSESAEQVSSIEGPDYCNRCEHDCKSQNFGECRPGVQRRSCYSKIVDFPLDGVQRRKTTSLDLGCVAQSACQPVNYTASLPNGAYIHMEVKCCYTNMCNIEVISAPKQKNRKLNEMQCPGCLVTNTTEPCSSDTTISCREHENRCISFTGRINTKFFYHPLLSFKGCATKTLCDLLSGDIENKGDLLSSIEAKEVDCSFADYPA